MAVDIFKKEVRPGDLIAYSGAGNGYMSVACVTRVMPKSVEHTGYPSRATSDKIVVITEEQASSFFNDPDHRTIQVSRQMKAEYNITD